MTVYISSKSLDQTLLLVIIFCLSISLVFADTESKIKIAQFGSMGDERAYNTVIDSEGNQYITGFTSGDLDGDGPEINVGTDDIFIVKKNKRGITQWIRQIGSPQRDRAHFVKLDSKGNIYVVGHTEGDLDGDGAELFYGLGDTFLIKLDSKGQLKWIRQFGTTGDDYGFGLDIDSSDNVYIAGYTTGDMDGNGPGVHYGLDDVFAAAFDVKGKQRWVTQIGSEDLDVGYAIITDKEGDIYMTGFTNGNFENTSQLTNKGEWDIAVVKLNHKGELEWKRQFGTEGTDYGYSVATDSDNLYIAGYVTGDLDGNNIDIHMGRADIAVLKLEKNGEKVWTRQFGSESVDWGLGIDVDRKGNVFVTGAVAGDLDGPGPGIYLGLFDMFSVILSEDGQTQQIRQWGTPGFDLGFTAKVINKHRVIITGQTGGDLDGAGPNLHFGGSDAFQVIFDYRTEDACEHDENQKDGYPHLVKNENECDEDD